MVRRTASERRVRYWHCGPSDAQGTGYPRVFFGPRREIIPSLNEVESLTPDKAIKVIRVGDLGLINGIWPVIGKSNNWERTSWPMPVFVRRDPLSRKAWKVYYSDTDPNLPLSEVRTSYEDTSLQPDSMYGSGAAEEELTELLS